MRYAQLCQLWSCCLLCTCAPHAQRSRLFSDEQLDNFADVVRGDGFVRMPGVYPKDKPGMESYFLEEKKPKKNILLIELRPSKIS
jgi:hypothetical protein